MAAKTKNVVEFPSGAAHYPPQSPKPAGSRKRVFTFQKRWLHTLPIIERSLPAMEVDIRAHKSSRPAAAGDSTVSVAATDDDRIEEFIVCMLCDDPATKRELTKVWSRSNCRRGRIENHLMSKHPEFMRLLQQKREAEGELAVQIFLQNLRDGRCNARTEINHGLYSQLSAECETHASPSGEELTKRALLNDYASYREMRHDVGESTRKRSKVEEADPRGKDLTTMAADVYSAGRGTVSPYADPEAILSPPWQTIFFNKLVVVTGGDNKAMASVATQLWLLGANVLITFTTLSGMDDFNTKHNHRFPDTSDSEENPRGIMLPVVGFFRTRKEISDWCSSIALKYQRVDFLLNYVGPEVVESHASKDPRSGQPKLEPMVSSVYTPPLLFCLAPRTLIEALNESMASSCFPDSTAGDEAWQQQTSNGIIVNIVSAQDEVVIESLVKKVAVKLQPRNIQVNCVLLPSRPIVESFDDAMTLSHAILFLLSPFSRLLSGSVLRVQHPETWATSFNTAVSVRRKNKRD